MIRTVIKRDGRKVPFEKCKIKNAILSAYKDVNSKKVGHFDNFEAEKNATFIADQIFEEGSDTMSVEEIQDIVEEKLMSGERHDVAKAYILYRNERLKERFRNSKMMKAVSDKIMAADVQNQNANVDERSFGGRKGEADSAIMRWYALNNCVSSMARENHLNNIIYIHDLDSYAVGCHNCLSIPFDKLLANGFNTRQTDVRPAQSINTAFQLLAVIFQIQSLQQFG